MSYKLYDAEIEYLQSTGAYITLPIVVNKSTYVCIEYSVTKTYAEGGGADSIMFGVWNSNSICAYAFLNGANQIRHRWGQTNSANLNQTKGNRLRFTASGNTAKNENLTLGTSVSTTIGNSFPDENFKLFHGTHGARIYSAKIGIFDFIPVRVGNVGYLFDKVSGQLFGNSGTGSFVLGPDVAPGRYANEIAFLESTGSQYIDTGIVPTGDIRLSVDGIYPTTTDNGLIHGCIDLDGNTYRRFHLGISGKYWQGGIGTTVNSSGSPDTSRHIFQISGRGVSYIDAYEITGDTTAFPSIPMYLFARNFSGTASNMGRFRIYGAYIYRYSTDEKIADFIPVEYNNIGYLYDKVSGEFFANQGTGKFVLGHRAPRFDGKACARSYTRRQLMVEGRKRLPYGYVELEYIQNTTGAWSTSAPYINTGLKPAADSVDGDTYSFEGAWSREGNLTSNWDAVFAANSGGSGASTWSSEYSGTSGTRIAVTTNTKGYKIINLSNGATGIKHTFKVSSSSVTIDNTTISAPTGKGTAITSNLLLFRRQSNGRGFPMKLYYFKVFKSGILLMDLIPCKNTNNVVGMFDLVSKSFFRSANSGTFVAGKIIY